MIGIRDRFKDAGWYPIEEPILVGGCGGIGSWFTFFAARTGAEIYIFDGDVIEEVNLSGQLFAQEHVGMDKVEALQQLCQNFSNTRITALNEMYTEDSDSNAIMIGGFDNMTARQVFFQRWKSYVLSLDPSMRFKCILIDGRLEAETFQIYCVTPDTMAAYEAEALFNDSEVPDGPACSFKQTTHVACKIAATMTEYLTNFLANVKLGRKIRKVPYFTAHSSAMAMTRIHHKPVTDVSRDDQRDPTDRMGMVAS